MFKVAKIKEFLIFILIFSWIFSGWPQIFDFPSGVKEARAAIAYVQSDTNQSASTSVTSLAVTFTSNVTVNNLIVVAVHWYSNTVTNVNTPTDTRSVSYSIALGPTAETARDPDVRSKIFYGFPNTSGANTVTITWASAIEQPTIVVSEYSGIATTGALDQALAGVGTSANPGNSGNVTTVQNDELLIGHLAEWLWTTHAPGTNYTEREDGTQGMAFEDRIVSATGAYNATYTLGDTVGGSWIMSIVTFRASVPSVRTKPHLARGKVNIRGRVKFR